MIKLKKIIANLFFKHHTFSFLNKISEWFHYVSLFTNIEKCMLDIDNKILL